MNTRNSDYVDAGAKAVAEPERDLNGERLDWVDMVWLGDLAGFLVDWDAPVFDQKGTWLVLEHSACGKVEKLPGIPQDGSWLANIVQAALEHECPETDNE